MAKVAPVNVAPCCRRAGRRLARALPIRAGRALPVECALAKLPDLSYKLCHEGFACHMQEPLGRVERRLSAILAADVAGYSRLMHNDEEATHAKLTALFADAVEPAIRNTADAS